MTLSRADVLKGAPPAWAEGGHEGADEHLAVNYAAACLWRRPSRVLPYLPMSPLGPMRSSAAAEFAETLSNADGRALFGRAHQQ